MIMHRCTCTNYGMLYEMHVGGGKEFHHSLGMQEIHSSLRSCQDISCYRRPLIKTDNICSLPSLA